ncbi:MAG: hypothetical protein KIT27_06015 [Legionellales bacterium]|nr:hypothetical protein [Legionellales bacterium]
MTTSIKLDSEVKRASFKQEALRSWESYQATGLHVTNHDLSTWLRTWGKESKKGILPKCYK